MTKYDLKTGMIIENRAGEKAIVLLNVDGVGDILAFFDGGWVSFKSFDDNLMHEKNGLTDCSGYDIFKVYNTGEIDMLANPKEIKQMELIWERGVKKISLEELEDYFGCKVIIEK